MLKPVHIGNCEDVPEILYVYCWALMGMDKIRSLLGMILRKFDGRFFLFVEANRHNPPRFVVVCYLLIHRSLKGSQCLSVHILACVVDLLCGLGWFSPSVSIPGRALAILLKSILTLCPTFAEVSTKMAPHLFASSSPS